MFNLTRRGEMAGKPFAPVAPIPVRSLYRLVQVARAATVREFPRGATGTRGDRRNEPEIDAPGRQEGLRIP